MSASGLWITLKNIERMPRELLSFLSAALEIVWSSMKVSQKKCSVSINNSLINCIPD